MSNAIEIQPETAPERVQEALALILASEAFARSERLKAFLSYIVEEVISGRADSILGKTIAQDVYDRDPSRTENAENLVRVDAGRLRRKLDAYYAAEGARDTLRIVIDPGGYVPRFEEQFANEPQSSAPDRGTRPGFALLLASAGVGALLVGGVALWLADATFHTHEPTSSDAFSAREAERTALAAKSTASVQAANLCDQARGFLFPIAEVESQRTAARIFEQAIATDPGLACGYAGLAHAQATLARLAEPGEARAELSAQADAMAGRAIELDPTNGWSHSAAAWTAFAFDDFAEAARLSALAVELSPRDGNVLDFRALITGASGDFKAALAATDPSLTRDFGSVRLARRNLRAVVLFHLGEYADSIASLEDAIRNGDPVSPLTLTFLAAGHLKAGNRAQAEAYARELSETWPEARPDIGLTRIYATEELAQQVLAPLQAAGWRAPEGAL